MKILPVFKKPSVMGLIFMALLLPVLAVAESEKAAHAIEVEDVAGHTIRLEKPADRIVATFFFEEIFALGAQDKIVGWSRGYWEGRRQWTWEKYIAESGFPVARIPDIGYTATGTYDIEKIASLRPDLVIVPFQIPDMEKALLKYGIPTLHVDFHTQENTCKSIRLMGELLGREKRARELVSFYEMQINRVSSVLAGIKDMEKPTVYIEVGINPYATFGKNYMFGKLADMAGGKNAADGFGILESGTVSPEFLLSADPDIIIFTCANWAGKKSSDNTSGLALGYYATLDQVENEIKEKLDRPGWSELKAVKKNRVYFIHHTLSRHIYEFVALQYFAKWFYPEAFQTLEPEKNWQEFHERFLPVTLSGKWSLP